MLYYYVSVTLIKILKIGLTVKYLKFQSKLSGVLQIVYKQPDCPQLSKSDIEVRTFNLYLFGIFDSEYFSQTFFEG